MMRTASLKVAVFLLVALSFGYPQQSSPRPSQRALLDQYCVGCHNQRLKTADLMLDKADPADPTANAELWEKVIRKLRAGAMPPQGIPRPPAAAVDTFVTYLEASLDRAAAEKPNPGRATLHRLNRAEYGNSIRDLLDLQMDVAALLPPDDESYGFDNNADVLGVSPALLEQYVNASSKIARLAVGDPGIGPVAATYRTRPDLSQDNRVEGLGLGTRGGMVVHHNFPLDGEYTFKIILARNTVDVIRGLEEEHQLEITVDGERVQLVTIGGKEDTDALAKNPADERQVIEARMMARAQVKAGPRTVGATFIKKNSAENDYILQPFQRITLDPVNEVGLPHIENFIIAGPYKATGPGDTPSRRKIFTCQPGGKTEDVTCARQILSRLARQAYRRPVTDNDLEPLLSFYQSGRNAGGSFDEGIERALRLILSDPQFIFRFERNPRFEHPSETMLGSPVFRLSDLELASRLSFFLWSSIPDDELISVATQGKLQDPAVLEKQVRRMLSDPRSESLVTNFADQWLFLRNMKNTFPDPQEFPDFDDNLRQSLQKETELFVGSIFHEDHNVLDLLNANYTFVNERVAKHYGIPNVYGSRFRKVTLTDENRRGLLGQASILAVTSHTTRTSPVVRGKWILSNLLGTPPPPPPPDVPALKENSEGGKPRTVRERMQEHRANPTCASCHNVMDPLGFALENFDATGRWRTTDSGAPVDTAGKLVDGTAVNGPASLRQALMSHPDVFVRTLTEKLMIYSLGRGLDYNDMPAVRAIYRDAAKNDYRFSSLILGIVKSTPFQMKTKADSDGKGSVGF
jgi:hypothetical protein